MSTGLTRNEKEKLVLELYSQGKTYHQIAKQARISLRDIGPILNKGGVEQSLSDSSRAYKLFVEGNTPIQVAIALNLKEPDATRFYKEYWNLRQLYELQRIYAEIRDDIWSLVNLYRSMRSADMDIQHVIRLLKIANNDISSIEYRIMELEKEEDSLNARNKQVARTFQELNDRILKENKTLEQYRSSCRHLKEEIENLSIEKTKLENAINSFQNNNETCAKIKQIVREEIESIMSHPRRLLGFALASIFESSRKHPGKLQALYYNMPATRTLGRLSLHSPIGDRQDEQYLTHHLNNDDNFEELLLDEAEQAYNRMVEELTGMCVDRIENGTESSSASFPDSGKERHP